MSFWNWGIEWARGTQNDGSSKDFDVYKIWTLKCWYDDSDRTIEWVIKCSLLGFSKISQPFKIEFLIHGLRLVNEFRERTQNEDELNFLWSWEIDFKCMIIGITDCRLFSQCLFILSLGKMCHSSPMYEQWSMIECNRSHIVLLVFLYMKSMLIPPSMLSIVSYHVARPPKCAHTYSANHRLQDFAYKILPHRAIPVQ